MKIILRYVFVVVDVSYVKFGIVYRDIKFVNVFVKFDGDFVEVWFGDFGSVVDVRSRSEFYGVFGSFMA